MLDFSTGYGNDQPLFIIFFRSIPGCGNTFDLFLITTKHLSSSRTENGHDLNIESLDGSRRLRWDGKCSMKRDRSSPDGIDLGETGEMINRWIFYC